MVVTFHSNTFLSVVLSTPLQTSEMLYVVHNKAETGFGVE